MSDKISIMLTSGKREALQMAAMVASVGAVSGSDVTVFVSMNAMQVFTKGHDGSVPTEGVFGELLSDKNAPGFLELFESAVELGDAKIHPCSMAIDVLELGAEDLADFIAEPLGLTKFLSDAAEGQVWTF